MNREPAVIAAAIEAVLVAAIAFGLDVSTEQLAAVVMAITVVGGLFVRSQVTPVASIEAELDV